MKQNETIRIKRGLDICARGEAALQTVDATAIVRYAVKPTDYVAVTPKILVKEGDAVKAGTPLFYDKNNEKALFTSPVGGTVVTVARGEKRALLRVEVAKDEKDEHEAFEVGNPIEMGAEKVKDVLLRSGAWTGIIQRPFGLVARPSDKPKAIFISGFDSAPLAPNYDYILGHFQGEEFSRGLDALHAVAGSVIHYSIDPTRNNAAIPNKDYLKVHRFAGKHPAGLVGTQINMIDPINKGDTVWVVKLQDVLTIGHLFLTGEYRPLRLVAIAGAPVRQPQYYKMLAGACIESLANNVTDTHVRYISGDMLSGTNIGNDGFMSAGHSLLTVLPEGDKYDFMGWLMPGFGKYSFSRTFLSGFCKSKKYLERCELNTGLHGGVRPYVVSDQFEKVFPLDIFPLELIKACIIGDIDLMEQLGIYEVEPEDFALCEFVDTSKTDIQEIIRNGLENCRLN
ncbi:MAG: Na(+)-translocating NADH-quinone reductase subunit A [Bacteroidales bacterium]|nr:Na(+)-translocating NADH-quinone reductase subunit A [Bacteroidales bacterium]